MTERTLRTISAGCMMATMILILLGWFNNTDLTAPGAALVGAGVFGLACTMNVTWQLANQIMDERETRRTWYQWLPHVLPSAIAGILVWLILS